MRTTENPNGWKYLALMLCDAQGRFDAADRTEASECHYRRMADDYRAYLMEMKRNVDEALAQLPPVTPVPEKVAGFYSKNVWA